MINIVSLLSFITLLPGIAQTYVFIAIEELKPKYILIENVPMLLKLCMPYKGRLSRIIDILKQKFGDEYEIEGRVVDAADYGVPQTRLRAIIKLRESCCHDLGEYIRRVFIQPSLP